MEWFPFQNEWLESMEWFPFQNEWLESMEMYMYPYTSHLGKRCSSTFVSVFMVIFVDP